MKIAKECLFAIALVAVALSGCQPTEAPDESADGAPKMERSASETEPGAAATEPDRAAEPNVVKVTVLEYAFQAPLAIPSGWSTFEMTNTGDQEHFMLLWRLPEGRTFADWQEEVGKPFGEEMMRYDAGELDRESLFAALGERLPDWFSQARPSGGIGVTAPDGTAATAVDLAPGEYVMECYVRNPEGKFHGELGMIRPLTVTEKDTGAPEPEADIRMTISNYDLVVDGKFERGRQTVRVAMADDPEGLLSHDIHLVRLDDEASLDEAIEWMDWVDAMYAPAPVEFLGGAEDMPAGSTAYVKIDLEPGRYAWISESYSKRGVVKQFQVD